MRIDDDLIQLPEGIAVNEDTMKNFLGILLSEKILRLSQMKKIKDVDTAFEWKEQGVNFRLNVFRDRDGLALSCGYWHRQFLYSEVGLPSEMAGYKWLKAWACIGYRSYRKW